MTRKCLLFTFSLMLLLVFSANWAAADSNKKWLFRSIAGPAYTLWLDGTITIGESGTTTESTTLSANECISADKWFIRGNAIYTPWARKAITYSFNSKRGRVRIGLSAKNFADGGKGWTKPTGYSHFKVDVYLDNKRKGRLSIGASDTQINSEYLNIEQLDKGHHKIKFVWVNDKYNPRAKQDANIEIHNVSIEQTY